MCAFCDGVQYCRPDLDDMLIANRADGCRSFFKCSSGTPVLTQCAGNLLFNEHTNYCDWEYNVQCDGVNYVVNQAASPFKLPVKCIVHLDRSKFRIFTVSLCHVCA